MIVDSHNHTCHFSADAKMTINELITSSIDKKVDSIVITEHYDLDYPHEDEPPMFCDIDAYVAEFCNWKKLSAALNGPELLMGIEFGFQEHLATKLDFIAESYNFDSIILSNHLFDGLDVWFYEDCYKLPANERNSRYIATLAYMASVCNNYDIIGHYDYINRYNPDVEAEITYDSCPEEFDQLFKTIISKGKSLEINTASIEKRIRNNAANVMPDSRIIKRYLELGGNMITLGSDAHMSESITINFEATKEYLKSLGVTKLCYFKNRKPVFYSI